jgi:hypothetical protein
MAIKQTSTKATERGTNDLPNGMNDIGLNTKKQALPYIIANRIARS